MATTLVTSVTPTEHDPSRSGSEDENRGTETEEESGSALLQPQTGPAATVTHSRLSKLPLARIKALMKTDPDVSLASQESVFIIAKATVNTSSKENTLKYSTAPLYTKALTWPLLISC